MLRVRCFTSLRSVMVGTTVSRRCMSTSVETLRNATVPPQASQAGVNPTLKEIPSLPVLGSFVPIYSGVPMPDLNNVTNYWRKLLTQYGPFFTIGVPGLGRDIHGTVYFVQD